MYQLCEMVYFEIPFKDRRFWHAEPNPCTCTSTFPKSGVFAFDSLYLFFRVFLGSEDEQEGPVSCVPQLVAFFKALSTKQILEFRAH